ncbi:MAG TPA: methyltransferase domain-containing protein [Chitinophagaceae bacterium]|jgi:ubiquinone/menaquinone biosynthesis C-methylase UbiE|nr:methyltransferase domain-containing protein [Chitinophagaceae bacterium]
MNPQLEEIREQQKQSWNKFSPGWKKWDDLTMDFLKPMGDEIIARIQPSGNNLVLDIAAGTGEPGLTIAAMIPGGKVIITDLAEDMLTIARENAAKKGVNNIETIACDVCELPFADNSFDAISCRFGFMFFPDMQLAAAEMYRVLKPGGKMATSVWNIPEKNFWITAMMGTIHKNMELSPPPPGAPGMFRCAKPGLMKEMLEKTGFRNIAEKEVPSLLNSGTVETYWDMMTEIGAPIVAALSKADDAMRQTIKNEVFALVTNQYSGRVAINGSALVISAEK